MAETATHLGGSIKGGDPATCYPTLWEYLVEQHGVGSVVDVGCGDGIAVDYFNSLGADALGIDGVEQEHPSIITHDFTTGPCKFPGHFDLVWSCEFVEHLEERYLPHVLELFARADLVLMTHAGPGQLGHHHVNCRSDDYWIGVMAAIGYTRDAELTILTRKLAAANQNPYNHYLRSGLAFLKPKNKKIFV